MQISEAKIFNFGTLQNRTFEFKPGINVIYGPNEAGKSTLHAFLTAMLFGMEKNKGRAAAGDMYTRYEPWHAPAYYSGAMRFQVGGKPFYLERNFYHKEKKELLRNEADGEELSVVYGDLAILLGGIGKEAFGNTYDITQSFHAGRYPAGKELSDILAEYLSDASGSGNGSTHVNRAVSILHAKEKELKTELKRLNEKRQQEQRELEIEQGLLKEDCIRLRKEVENAHLDLETLKQRQQSMMQVWSAAEESEQNVQRGEERNGQNRKKQSPKDNSQKNSRKQIRTLLTAGTAAIGLFLNVVLYFSLPYPAAIFWVTEAMFAVGCFLGVVSVRRRKTEIGTSAGHQDTQEAETAVWTDKSNAMSAYGNAAIEQAGKMFHHLRDSLLEKETRLYNITEQIREGTKENGSRNIKDTKRERELSQSISALQLAAAEIERLAREFCEDMQDELNAEVSRTVSALTDGKYDSVRVDSSGRLKVQTEGREVAPDALSTGTLEQLYLALRLSVGNIVTAQEPMPIFLDEAFVMYDDHRLMQTLRFLAGMNRQIFIFTCQSREKKFLEQMGITYHKVNLL